MSSAPAKLTLSVVPGVPLVKPGDDLGAILIRAIGRADLVLRAGDVVVVAQKVVSKAQNRFVSLDKITPSPRARKIAAALNKDPRFVEVILSDSVRVVRHRNLLISGFILANAGVDRSNVSDAPESDIPWRSRRPPWLMN